MLPIMSERIDAHRGDILGFTPLAEHRDGKTHQIELKLKPKRATQPCSLTIGASTAGRHDQSGGPSRAYLEVTVWHFGIEIDRVSFRKRMVFVVRAQQELTGKHV